MLKWLIAFAVVSLIAGGLGFKQTSAAAGSIARILFFIMIAVVGAVVAYAVMR